MEMIENRLGEQLKYNGDLISDYLLNPYGRDEKDGRLMEMLAEEEIDRVIQDERTGQLYLNAISSFEDNVEAQVKKAVPTVFSEIYFRLLTEAIMASAPIIDDAIGRPGEFDPKFFGEFVDTMMRRGRRFMNERLGIKRGGKRLTKKFVWTDDRKREFFEKVSSLVHETGEPLWRFAYDELREKDFSYRIVDWLRTETPLKEVPNDLWTGAMKAWKGGENGFGRLEAPKTPEAFAMYHALHLLGYPETTYSTLKKYFGQGKKLSVTKIST